LISAGELRLAGFFVPGSPALPSTRKPFRRARRRRWSRPRS